MRQAVKADVKYNAYHDQQHYLCDWYNISVKRFGLLSGTVRETCPIWNNQISRLTKLCF